MKLSVIIVNYNVRYFLEQCLRSVSEATTNIESEIWVVDNNSVDGSVEMIQEKFPEVKLIANEKNAGFSRANNQAIEKSEGEYILLLNPDTVVEPDTLGKSLAFMDAHTDAGGLGVKMVDGKGKFLPESKRGLPTPSVAFYKISGLASLFPRSKVFGKYHLGYLEENTTHEVDILSGAFMLLRKEALDKTGALDETFFMYGEDIDLSYRLQQAGYKNYYFPETRIIHYKGESTKKSSINYVLVFYRAMVIFAKKHFSVKHARTFSALINVAIWLRATVAIAYRFLSKAIIPLTDFAVILAGLYVCKYFYTEKTGIVYADELVNVAFPLYVLVWITAIFLGGGYDRPVNLKRIVVGLLAGTLVILSIYGLLEEQYRFSRALILLGFSGAILSLLLLRVTYHLIGPAKLRIGEKHMKRFAIIGDLDERKRVNDLLRQTHFKVELAINVAPDGSQEKNTPDFVAGLHQLKEVVEIFKIDEVVFCAKNIPANEIINQMAHISAPELEYKIAPAESPYIIGSHSIAASGDLYAMSISAIDKPTNRRNKRIVDVCVSLLFLPLSPLLMIPVKKPLRFLQNIFMVLAGLRSWVGYANQETEASLPRIKKGVLNTGKTGNHEDSSYSKYDLSYARNYSVFNDLKIIWKEVVHLGN